MGLLLLVCACGPEATPLPVNLPTLPPPTPTVGLNAPTPAPLRYAIAPNLLPFLSSDDSALISASAVLIPLTEPPDPADLGVNYDFVVAFGDLPKGTLASNPLQVSLVLNTALSPLDNSALADAVRHALDPAKVVAALAIPGIQPASAAASDEVALRTELANAGYPDGFDLTISAQIAPGAAAIVKVLAAVGIDARIVTTPNEPVHLMLTTIQSSNAIPLFAIPISYRAVDGLNITFATSGLPIAKK